jgi:hypothetical protein
MTRHPLACSGAVLALTLALAFTLGNSPAPALQGDDAKAIAVKVTTAGAALFDAKDSKALAATYLDDARLEIISRDKDSTLNKIEVKTTHAEIEAYYESILKTDTPIHAKNVVEHARLIQPDLLLITGIFTPDTESADPLNLPFVQTRQRQGDSWRIVTLQLYVFPQK